MPKRKRPAAAVATVAKRCPAVIPDSLLVRSYRDDAAAQGESDEAGFVEGRWSKSELETFEAAIVAYCAENAMTLDDLRDVVTECGIGEGKARTKKGAGKGVWVEIAAQASVLNWHVTAHATGTSLTSVCGCGDRRVATSLPRHATPYHATNTGGG